MKITKVCMLGGSGFVGQHVARTLAAENIQVKVLTRHRERNKALLVLPGLAIEEANIFDEAELKTHFLGMDAVINLVGILHDSAAQGFQTVHVELPRKIVSACVQSNVPRLLHMSALGAQADAPSGYLRSKFAGEAEALKGGERGLSVTVFRPSVIFGPNDNFLNLFAKLVKLFPVIPLGSPQAKFQPVYVADVALAFVRSLDDKKTYGKSLSLCGPTAYTLRELINYIANALGLRRTIIPLSSRLSYFQALVFEYLPGKLITRDNLNSMQVDNVCSEPFPFDFPPTPLEAVAPAYLKARRPQPNDAFRSGAGR